jgi:hypothetical protein
VPAKKIKYRLFLLIIFAQIYLSFLSYTYGNSNSFSNVIFKDYKISNASISQAVLYTNLKLANSSNSELHLVLDLTPPLFKKGNKCIENISQQKLLACYAKSKLKTLCENTSNLTQTNSLALKDTSCSEVLYLISQLYNLHLSYNGNKATLRKFPNCLIYKTYNLPNSYIQGTATNIATMFNSPFQFFLCDEGECYGFADKNNFWLIATEVTHKNIQHNIDLFKKQPAKEAEKANIGPTPICK